LTIEDIRRKLLSLQEEEDEVTRLDEQKRHRIGNLRTKVKQMIDEILQNGGEQVQRWLHDSYNGSNDHIHSNKSFGIVHQTSKYSTETVRSQRPENFVSVGDKTHLNGVFKLLARQVLGIDFPKFFGDVKEWLTFITTSRRTTKDCDTKVSSGSDEEVCANDLTYE
jgi:hypothetical protein